MFHELDAERLEDSEAVVPAPIGPPSLGPFRRKNLELGCTYTAMHNRLDVKVTVQVVRPMRREERDKIIHGIKTVQQYRDFPFIHRLLWITQRGDNLYLMTEYPEDSLHSLVTRTGPLDLHVAKSLFAQTLAAVSALHSNHTVHRNLTLRTLLVCGGVVKLSGFDWVNQFCDKATDAIIERSLEYCSPEVVARADITKYDRTKTDMWALGVILWAMVCGEMPFTGECGDGVADAIAAANPTLPRGLDPEVVECLEALLHPDPSCRPTAMQLLRFDWFVSEYDRIMDAHDVEIPPSRVDDEMAAYGFPHDHITASRYNSEYNLASAERFLVETQLKLLPPDDTSAPLVPIDPSYRRASSRCAPTPERHTGAQDRMIDAEVPTANCGDAMVPSMDSRVERRASEMSADVMFDGVDSDEHAVKPPLYAGWSDTYRSPWAEQSAW
mmetsp:Transcript_23813/g.62332  ORF Transcript_23813/g.62332 Transcript_23813/m.62332 type:complete len:441 (-) Transcript_23813:208-1530(-)